MLKTIFDTGSLALDWLRINALAYTKHSPAPPGKHLVLLAWALPPNTNAGVFRPLSFLQYGVEAGWRIDAFHGPVPDHQRQHGDELLAKIPKEVTLHKINLSMRQPAWRLTPHVDGGFVEAIDIAKQCIRTLGEEPPDIVLASGPPFCMFVAALFVSRRFNAKLVLDYRDEWTECPFDFVVSGPHDRRWERKCLGAADAVLFTTESHRRHQLDTFPQLDEQRAYLIPNGWEDKDFITTHETLPITAPSSVITISHVGNLAGHTPPDRFLQAVAELMHQLPEWRSKLRIALIGPRSQAADKAIRAFPYQDCLQVVDQVGKREANQRMQASDVLLLLAVPDLERYLPGKLFDYVASRRPILVYGAPGEAFEVVRKLGIGSLCSPEEGSQGLLRVINDLAQRDISSHQHKVEDWLQAHRRDVLAKSVFAILLTLLPANVVDARS